jgi:hypothetical protein
MTSGVLLTGPPFSPPGKSVRKLVAYPHMLRDVSKIFDTFVHNGSLITNMEISA